jgi:CDP-diacylglycerol--serine O-phosphatidyltransferase
MVMYKMIGATTSHTWLPYVAFMIAVFSALRLAIFNVDETQSDSFKGLNTPANTLFVTSLPLIAFQVGPWLFQEEVLVAITLVFSFLLVSPLRFFAFKFKNFSWADNWLRFTFVGISVLLLVLFQVSAIPLIILLYIVSSLVDSAIGWKL